MIIGFAVGVLVGRYSMARKVVKMWPEAVNSMLIFLIENGHANTTVWELAQTSEAMIKMAAQAATEKNGASK